MKMLKISDYRLKEKKKEDMYGGWRILKVNKVLGARGEPLKNIDSSFIDTNGGNY